jgi:hypothetical protein
MLIKFFVIHKLILILCLVLRVYKKPLPYTSTITETVVRLFKYGFIFHFLIGFFMYSNISIIPHSYKTDKEVTDLITYFDINKIKGSHRLKSTHIIIFLIAALIYTLILFFRLTIYNVCQKVFTGLVTFKREYNKEDLVSDDFYK